MSVNILRPLVDANSQWTVAPTGFPAKSFYDYLRDLDRVIRALIGQTQPVTVAGIATGTPGQTAFVSNALKVGESTGHGTGTLAYFDGTAWRRVGDDTTISA